VGVLPKGESSRILQLPTGVQRGWNRCSGSPESAFSMAGIGVHDDRNPYSASVGIGVLLRSERAFRMDRNTQRTQIVAILENSCAARCPFFALSTHQRAANGRKRRHNAKRRSGRILGANRFDPTNEGTWRQSAANHVVSGSPETVFNPVRLVRVRRSVDRVWRPV
jgi:hypothetical protein